MHRIKIGSRYIGDNKPVFIIAEIGSNHNQDLKIGKKLIDVAYKAGVDAVKFQSFTVENWVSKGLKSFPTLAKNRNVYKQLKKCELSYGMYEKFKRYAENRGLVCFSSPSHIEDVEKLDKIGATVFKFGSVQITDFPTIKHAAKKGKPIIISGGASTLEDIREAIDVIRMTGNKKIILLHCTSLYPTKMNQVHLNVIKIFKEAFPGVIIGYSDHTLEPITIPAAAVTMGVCVFEKHITLNRKMKGPDHKFALEPEDLKMMVKAIRDVEEAFGSSAKKPLMEEREIMRLGRRSIVAKVNIARGTIISRNMLTTKRPGYGIEPKFLDEVVGTVAKMNIVEDELLSWKKIKSS